jgi:hypothetical protein
MWKQIFENHEKTIKMIQENHRKMRNMKYSASYGMDILNNQPDRVWGRNYDCGIIVRHIYGDIIHIMIQNKKSRMPRLL